MRDGRCGSASDERVQTAAGRIDVRALAAQFQGRKVAETVSESLDSRVRTGLVATANNGAAERERKPRPATAPL